MTKVVNKKLKEPFDVYIGRPTMFGNPFSMGRDGNRAEVIQKFRTYFYKRLEEDPYFKAQILALKGKRLACFCAPLACHGDVIVEFLEKKLTEIQK